MTSRSIRGSVCSAIVVVTGVASGVAERLGVAVSVLVIYSGWIGQGWQVCYPFGLFVCTHEVILLSYVLKYIFEL